MVLIPQFVIATRPAVAGRSVPILHDSIPVGVGAFKGQTAFVFANGRSIEKALVGVKEATFTICGQVRCITSSAVDLGIVERSLRKEVALDKHTLIGSDGSRMP